MIAPRQRVFSVLRWGVDGISRHKMQAEGGGPSVLAAVNAKLTQRHPN
jgi:hypothetical protein